MGRNDFRIFQLLDNLWVDLWLEICSDKVLIIVEFRLCFMVSTFLECFFLFFQHLESHERRTKIVRYADQVHALCGRSALAHEQGGFTDSRHARSQSVRRRGEVKSEGCVSMLFGCCYCSFPELLDMFEIQFC